MRGPMAHAHLAAARLIALEDLLTESVPCPRCLGRCVADSLSNQLGQPTLFRKGMPYCRLCKGHGRVYPNRVCECGGPSVFRDEKLGLWYCGRELCLKAKYHRLFEPVGSGTFPWGPNVPGMGA